MTQSSRDDQAGQLSTAKIKSAVDGSYLLNVGESDAEQLELQLYRLPGEHKRSSSGATPENEIFRLDATGMLQASVRKRIAASTCVLLVRRHAQVSFFKCQIQASCKRSLPSLQHLSVHFHRYQAGPIAYYGASCTCAEPVYVLKGSLTRPTSTST